MNTRHRSITVWVKIAAIVTLSIWIVVLSFPRREFQLWFMDVGQGDATFIRTPENRKILIDGGPDQSVLRGISNALPFWDHQIDLLFITHLHADHIGGVIEVLKRYKVKHVFLNPSDYQSPFVDELNNQIQQSGATVRSFTQGDTIKIGKNFDIKALWPSSSNNTSVEDINDQSLVIVIEYGRFKALFPADFELNGIRVDDILRNYDQVDLIKVSHQGSKDSIDSRLLNKIKPIVAVISVGRNSFGQPAAQILKLLAEYNIKTYRTDVNNTVYLTVEKNGDYKIISK